MKRSIALLVAAIVAALVPLGPSAGANPGQRHAWISAAPDPAALQTSIAEHGNKTPAEFFKRLKYALPDGTLQVMVALTNRDEQVEDFIENNTSWLRWYGDSPRFLARITQQQMVTLLNHASVMFVEPDYKIKNFMSTSSVDVNARSVGSQGTGIWSYDAALNALKTEIPELTVDMATGKGVTVSIIDSGIDRTHRDFGGFNCAPGPFTPCESRITHAVSVGHVAGLDEGDPLLPTTEAASGHGTHVAGTIAGNAYYTRDEGAEVARYGGDGHNFGIAPQASLISLKNGDTLWAGLSSFGLEWTLEHAQEYGIRVSSNSWGCLGGCAFNGNSATGQQFRDLYNAGVLVVFAAGNDGGTSGGAALSGNAQSPYVLGVASYDDANKQLASSSSRGNIANSTLYNPATWSPLSEPVNGTRRPDLGAPGVSIWSAATLTGGAASITPRVWLNDADQGKTGTFPYRSMSGTSMATPHVAGAAALLYSACPEAQTLDVMRAIMAGANTSKVKKTGGTGVAEPYEVGYGGLDIRASLEWLADTHVCAWAANRPTPEPGEEPAPEPTEEPNPEPTGPPSPPTGDPVETTLYMHGPNALGEIDGLLWMADLFPTYVPLTLDGVAPTGEQPKSMNYFNPALNDLCTGLPSAFPTFRGPLNGYITGDVTMTMNFLAAPQPAPILARIWTDVPVFSCNDAYVAPAREVEVTVQPGQTSMDIVFEDLQILANEHLMIEILAPSGGGYAGQVGRVLYDSTTAISKLQFDCIPAGGATSCIP